MITVAIVEDDDVIREGIKEYLESQENLICTAAKPSVEHFLAVLNVETVPDVILMDIGMPGMGGYKCFEELLKINPGAIIMITTGYSKDEKVNKALHAGAASYLGKPYKLSFLLKSVRKTLDDKVNYKDKLKN